jgi:hypothetical protein
MIESGHRNGGEISSYQRMVSRVDGPATANIGGPNPRLAPLLGFDHAAMHESVVDAVDGSSTGT